MNEHGAKILYGKILEPQRWCIECEALWRGDTPCFCCNEKGVAAPSVPKGWPVTTTENLLR